MGQCSVFVRNREQFAQPPFNLRIDELFVARLTDFISELALKGDGPTGQVRCWHIADYFNRVAKCLLSGI
jgi:hypothetical protein